MLIVDIDANGLRQPLVEAAHSASDAHVAVSRKEV